MPNKAIEFPLRPDHRPEIYAYEVNNPLYKGFLKVGWTTIGSEKRVAQQFPVIQPGEGKPYRIVFIESAMRSDGTSFTDHAVHDRLEANGIECVGGEWYRCSADEVRNSWLEVRDRTSYGKARVNDFSMRPEQEDAVARTVEYFKEMEAQGIQSPKYLWNAKMRFGKTFAAYQLARQMEFERVLVLTFKPAVEDAWEEDLLTHVDFEGWQFVSRGGTQYEECDPAKPIVCFGSFQDFLGYDKETGGIKPRNEWVHLTDWDLVIFDEYHFGAWRETAQSLFKKQDEEVVELTESEEETIAEGNNVDERDLPIQSRFYLFLSGTPFRALNSGEFIEEQIFPWTYSDEQKAKLAWPRLHPGKPNPYAALPRVVMMTYKVPDEITKIAREGEFNQFDLNVFFSTVGKGKDAQFRFKEYVQKWLDLIRGSYKVQSKVDLKLGSEKPPLPFSDIRLLGTLTHTLWFLPNVASCQAMANLLAEKQNTFYHDYKVIVAAGAKAGIGLDALPPVRRAMGDPLRTKSITLTCGKLTTGVTVKPWSGIFMLRNLRSPETYFQAAFRVQSPWEVDGEHGKEIMKEQVYIFDFALDRALSMVSDYSTKLATKGENPEKVVGEFIQFLPVLAYDGAVMTQVSASQILEMTMSGTSATMLAKRWECALLVNVDDATLRRVLADPRAMEAIMSIEAFRKLGNNVLETIVNKSEEIKKAKKEGEKKTPKEKKELSEEEEKMKSLRKKVQDILIKFATRIPVFMYLTDFREACLKDVITRLEPELFLRVTGLKISDFELLVNIGVFNEGLMNETVYMFRRYEDSSLTYTGIDRHAGEAVGLFDTALSREDYTEEAKRDTYVGVEAFQATLDEAVGLAEAEQEDELPEELKAEERSVIVESPVATNGIPEEETADDEASDDRGWTYDDLDDLQVGDFVTHRAFGVGPITRFADGYIYACLKGKERMFAFPGAFESGFLSLD